MNFEPVSQIKVSLCFNEDILPVGRLATSKRNIFFEFDSRFIDQGLEISPINCSIRAGVQEFDPFLFEGLAGVFNDSLPDGWGRLLFDRQMRSYNVLPNELSPLDRLSHVGKSGMGALIYGPDFPDQLSEGQINIEVLAHQVSQVLSGEATDVLGQLLALNGSSGGARPKAMIGLHKNGKDVIHGTHQMNDDYQPCLVKFPNQSDGVDAGAIEYVYALMAVDAGLEMPEANLLPAQSGSGYFAVQRFDRKRNNRLHMHTACGLLHSDYRYPSLDYSDLTKLTAYLTRDMREVEKLFRLAVFNVFAHNRDDHAKNFSYLMDKSGAWKLSPAYDLTYSSGPFGQQSTMVMGEGGTPGRDELIKLGLEAKLPRVTIDTIIAKTREALSKWPKLANEYGVTQSNIDLISAQIVL